MAQRLHAGAAAVVVTPPLGVSLAGSYGDRRATGVLNDLHARALVLDDGATEAALIVLDLCWIADDVASRMREEIARATGIPGGRTILSATHTHSGPVTEKLAWYEPDASYLDVLVRRTADAVALARQRKQPARLLAGRGREASLSFNRRYWMRDGTLRTNPPFQSPDIVRPAGPIDPEVGVLRADDAETGRPIALLVNVPLHVAVVGGTAISADYPGVLADYFHRQLGPGVVTLFAIGCCGDVNHWDVRLPGPQNSQAMAERIGTVLAGEVAKVNARLEPVADGAALRCASREVDLPLRVPSAEELAWATERRDATMRQMDAEGLEAVRAHRVLRARRHGAPTKRVLVRVLAIGEVAYVSLPGEIFVELGMAIKEASPFPHTLVGELNGTAKDYVPTRKAYGEGGYEVVSSVFAEGSGERLVEAALDLLRASPPAPRHRGGEGSWSSPLRRNGEAAGGEASTEVRG